MPGDRSRAPLYAPAMFPARIFLLTFLMLATSLPPALGQEDDIPIWTTKPTHIDRANQHYQRLPALVVAREKRTWIMVPQRIKVLDSVSFSFGAGTYVVAGLRPVRPGRICQAVEGGRWPCGRMSSIFLGNMVRGKRLLCEVSQSGTKILLRHCLVGTRDLASDIVSQGYGKAEGDAELGAIQAEAVKAAAQGLWRNPLCTNDFDHC